MAACSGSTPIGRPSPGPRDRLADFGKRVTLRQTNFEGLERRPRDRLQPGRRCPLRPRACAPTSWPTRSAASVSAPPARWTCASTHRAAARRAGRWRTGETNCATSSVGTARSLTLDVSPAPSSSGAPGARSKLRAQLAAVVEQAAPAPLRGRRRVHPATRVFQALRIHVNRELETLPRALEAAVDAAAPGGRLAVISYHSLEDRIVKRFIASERRGCTCPPELPVCVCGRSPRLAPLGKQPQRPSAAEIARNPRSRSALLRSARRLAA